VNGVRGLRVQDPVQVGAYRLVGRLGAGGMGEVFLARGPSGPAAVKIVHSTLAHDERFRRRFRREIDIGRGLTSPWTAGLLDADADAPRPWLASEYVAGPSLRHAVEIAGPLPASAAHVLAAGLARALMDIHGAGTTHHDVSPANVLLAAERPRLVDFGIARSATGGNVTGSGMAVGTPGFSAPEHEGAAEPAPPADVFGAGAAIAYAATGRCPFGAGPPMAVLLRVADAPPDLDGVPDRLRDLLMACLAKDPTARPTAAELVAALDPVPATGHRGWLPPGPVFALAVDLERARDEVLAPSASAVAPAGAQRRALTRRALLRRGALVVGAGAVAAGAVAVVRGTGSELPALAPPAGPSVEWSRAVAEDIWALGVGDGSVYALTNSVVHELRTSLGYAGWTAPNRAAYGLQATTAECAVLAGMVVVTTSTGVVALDRSGGQLLWDQQSLGRFVRSFATDTEIAVTSEGEVRLLESRVGATRWSGPLSARFSNRPLLAAGSCFVTGPDHVTAFDSGTGRQLWRVAVEDEGTQTESSLAHSDGVLVRVGDQSTVALDAATGAQRWMAPVGAFSAGADPCVAIAAGAVHVRANGVLMALDAGTGAVRWTAPGSDGVRLARGPIEVAAGVLVASDTGRVQLRDRATGVVTWEYAPPDVRLRTLDVAAGSVVLGVEPWLPIEGEGRIDVLGLPT
jgi:outer membrane protein assembly factor BamB